MYCGNDRINTVSGLSSKLESATEEAVYQLLSAYEFISKIEALYNVNIKKQIIECGINNELITDRLRSAQLLFDWHKFNIDHSITNIKYEIIRISYGLRCAAEIYRSKKDEDTLNTAKQEENNEHSGLGDDSGFGDGRKAG